MALNRKNTPVDVDMAKRLEKQLNGDNKPTHTDTDTYAYADKKETKSKRLYLLAKPSVHQKLDEYAKANGDTFNNLVHTLMEDFIEKNKL